MVLFNSAEFTRELNPHFQTYVCTFLERGGFGVVRDLLTECANRTKQETSTEASKLKVNLVVNNASIVLSWYILSRYIGPMQTWGDFQV